mmetsp:Transcript_501/g.2034  ORF Transcript_501/g.2034 Transcript_501/m.2034 type:complete len:285 (+) Transcript_501:210-1064(+)
MGLIPLRHGAETRAKVTALLGIPARRRRGLRPVTSSSRETTSASRHLFIPRLRTVCGIRDGVVPGGFHGRGGGSRGFLFLLLQLFRIAVEEQIDHNIPRVRRGDRAAHLQHHTGEQIVQATDGVLRLVVRRDRDVDVLQRRVRVAERNRRQVHVRSFRNRLRIRARISQDQHARFRKQRILLVRKRPRRVAARDGFRTSVLRKLQHRALTVRPSALAHHILRIFRRNNNPRREHELIPRASEVNDMDPIRPALPHVALHLEIHILRTEVAPGGEHHLDVSLLLR